MDRSMSTKNTILQEMITLDLHPVSLDEGINTDHWTKLPFSQIATLGTAFEPILSAFQSVFLGQGKSGLYWVTVPSDTHLAQFADGSGYLGSVLKDTTSQLSGQSVLSPLVLNPTMLFMAATLFTIDRKLEKIQETQQKILTFLLQKEHAEQRGNLQFLADILNNYKYNWNNAQYKSSNHIKVLDVKQASEQKIFFLHEHISSSFRKRPFLHNEQIVKKQLADLQSIFQDYQLALYLYAFSSFLDVMLLENFDVSFLDSVINKIETYSLRYRDCYTKCYNQIENYSSSSIESRFLAGLSSASSNVGKAIEKIPFINKAPLDEALLETGERIRRFNAERTALTLQDLVKKQNGGIPPFVDNLKSIKELYGHPLKVAFDREALYLCDRV